MAERVVKFSEWLTRTSKWLTHQFERVHRMTEWVIKVFEWLTRTDEPLTYPFERLIKISKRVPQTLHQENPSTLESFFKSKMHSAHVNNFMQILAEIWPTSNLNTRRSVVWQDRVTDDTRLFQLLESLSFRSFQYKQIENLKWGMWNQGCGLTAPGRLRRLTFSFGRLKKSSRSPGRALLLLVQCSVKRAEKFNILVLAYWVRVY